MKRTTRLALIEARKQHRWSQRTVANRIGTTQHNVSRWEQGHTSPGPFFLAKLCKLYGKQPHELDLCSLPADKEQLAFPLSPLSLTQRAGEAEHSLHLLDIPRNPFFTGREDILRCLHEYYIQPTYKSPKRAMALCGLEGCGKTQVALEFFYQHQQAYPFIFWLDATSNDTLLDGLYTMMHHLGLSEVEGYERGQAFLAVRRWLKTHPQWLLVIDNVNELAVIREFVQMECSGHLLLTSRNSALEALIQRIEVPAMGMAEATLFLLRRSNLFAPDGVPEQLPPEMVEIAEHIVSALHCFPLSVDQAGAMIEDTGCRIIEYRDMYQRHRQELLQYCGQGYSYHTESLAHTWLRSFRLLGQMNPAAAAVLRLCVFLAPDAIPEELISDGHIYFSSLLQEFNWDMFVFNNAIRDLRTFSFVQRNNKSHLLSVHPLLQVVLRDAMKREEQQIIAEMVVQAVNKLFSAESKATRWPRCLRYLAQVQICVVWIREYQFTFEAAEALLRRVACYLQDAGLYEQTEQLIQNFRSSALSSYQSCSEYSSSLQGY